MHRNYLNNVTALYANGKAVAKKKKRKKPVHWEDIEQIKFVTWLTNERIIFYHIPNGGSRHKFEAYRLKRLGVQPGVPDICIPIPSKGLNSLYIELKRQSGGVTSPEQRSWLKTLNLLGHRALVCNGFDNAKAAVIDYLS